MKQIPILYSKPMILACLSGRKNQTRRLLKHQPPANLGFDGVYMNGISDRMNVRFRGSAGIHTQELPHQKDDVLWVRESWSGEYPFRNCPPADREDFQAFGNAYFKKNIWYWADGDPDFGEWEKPRPSIHMPKYASRMSQIVTEVRVERLNSISGEDAVSEGIDWPEPYLDCCGSPEYDGSEVPTCCGDPIPNKSPEEAFRILWDSINGKPRRLKNGSLGPDISWAANPWIVATTFEVINKNISEIVS